MKRTLPIIRGRGASGDPPNRFERLSVQLDPEEAQAAPHERETHYLRDPARTVLTRNRSPDVGFDWSLNPYRGCEHGCVYCLAPDTPILYADMSWRPMGDVSLGDKLIGFDEYSEPGRTRKLRPAIVQRIWWSRKPTLRMVTDHTEVTTTAEHRWLQARGFRWSRTEQLGPGRSLRYLPISQHEPFDDDYRAGYVTGISLGDATFRFEPNWRSDKLGFAQAYWRLALTDREPLERVVRYLGALRVEVEIRPFSPGIRRKLQKVETRSLGKLARIHAVLTRDRNTRSYRRGFLAGFFDAEGHNGTSLRVFQVDERPLERVRRYGLTLGFRFELESARTDGARSLRLVGTLADRMRFFAVCRPAIGRKRDSLFDRTPPTSVEEIRAVEPGPMMDVVDIQTSTGTFYAAGLATHNCYARPTHEYLGFSAGLDFESRILVKEQAPELLEREISKPSWKPTTLVMSGVTDPYQIVERKTEVTRRCLEVLARARHPVALITKSRLVERDADLLAELARHDAAHVTLSITTLDRGIQRALEPRASPPEHRLAALRTLAEAGVPVAVNVAPVIPGLTEHEIPAIIQAAAEAGATGAGYVVLRLPGAVEPLFLAWLQEHAPDRVGKVVSRLRSLRGGALYDATFGTRMSGEGPFARQIADIFDVARTRAGMPRRRLELSAAAFERPAPPRRAGTDRDDQLDLF